MYRDFINNVILKYTGAVICSVPLTVGKKKDLKTFMWKRLLQLKHLKLVLVYINLILGIQRHSFPLLRLRHFCEVKKFNLHFSLAGIRLPAFHQKAANVVSKKPLIPGFFSAAGKTVRVKVTLRPEVLKK